MKELDEKALAYGREKGDAALARHLSDSEGRCPVCWSRPGEPHSSVCPNRDPDEDAAPPTQDEALF